MKKYHTQQRERLFAFFAENKNRQFTAEEAKAQIDGISISAVYRNINQMVALGKLRRFQKEGSRKFLFQYLGDGACAGHMHMKCSVCGIILHMDPVAEQAVQEVLTRHRQFRLNVKETVLSGCCAACDRLKEREETR